MAQRTPYQPAYQDRFEADDFFDIESEGDYDRTSYLRTEGSLAVAPEYTEMPSRPKKRQHRPDPRKRTAPAKKKHPAQKAHSQKRTVKRAKHHEGLSLLKRYERFTEAHDMVQIKNKFVFYLCAGLLMIGSLSMVLMYVRVFGLKSDIGKLETELAAAQDTNMIAHQNTNDQMNMSDLQTYAVGTLGMVEADQTTTITIVVANQSYTTSNLPVQEIRDSKVTFHWFN